VQEGIDWSVPVLVKKDRRGKLHVEIPDQVAAKLAVGPGDVICFTSFAGGGIEFWSVKKSPYTSLEDRKVAARLKKESRR
jgi:hypothetical protein